MTLCPECGERARVIDSRKGRRTRQCDNGHRCYTLEMRVNPHQRLPVEYRETIKKIQRHSNGRIYYWKQQANQAREAYEALKTRTNAQLQRSNTSLGVDK